MKKFRLPLLLLLAACSSSALAGCKKSSGGDPDDPTDGYVTVNFYLDYNKEAAGEIYETQKVKNGSKVTEPTKPTEAPFPEFPNFLGWSEKEIIDNKSDLWNFSKNKIKTNYSEFSLFGIWVAEGEN